MALQDLRFAVRMLAKNPGFTLVTVLSLAVGIGANSSMFSLADALLLRPLPVARPSEIVNVQGKSPSNAYENVSYRDYLDFRDRNHSFAGLAGYTMVPFGLQSAPDRLSQVRYGLLVTGNFLKVMGVTPEIGRDFRPDEDQAPGRDAVVILGHDLWVQEFSGDKSVVGRHVRLNNVDFNVIGVLPEKFTGMDQYFHVAMLVPVMMSPRLAGNPKHNILEGRDNRALQLKGRLQPRVSLPQAEAELAGIAKGLEQTYPDTNREQSVAIRTELQTRVERSPPDAALLAMLMTLSCLVLLVACANVANLLLSKSRARAREMTVRVAIGAGRARLIRQLLTESLLIGLGGGMAGIGLAYLGTLFFQQIQIPSDLPFVLKVELNLRALGFAALASLVSVLFFGLAPALQTSRTDLVRGLKSTDLDASGKPRVWGRNLLVMGQLALALVLLVVTGMLYRGFATQLVAGSGFRTDHIMMMSFDPTLVRYSEAQAQQFYKQIADRGATITGVKSVALGSTVPMSPNQNMKSVAPEGFQFPKGQKSADVFSSVVNERYFDALRVKLVKGRAFLPTDTATAPRVAIVNEVFAKKYWPNQDPVGKRMHVGDSSEWTQIVGVAATGKYLWIAEPPLEFLYLPLEQNPQPRMTLFAETAGAPLSAVPALREFIRSLDANQPIYDVRSLEDFYQMRAVATPNLIMQTVGGMGMMGLGLALVGLYGLVAYSVSRRTREFGIRMAIGAGRGQVLTMVLRHGLKLALGGIGIGLVLSLIAQRLVSSTFIGSRGDASAILFVPPLLLLVTLAAAYLPALRASRVDPVRALRYE